MKKSVILILFLLAFGMVAVSGEISISAHDPSIDSVVTTPSTIWEFAENVKILVTIKNNEPAGGDYIDNVTIVGNDNVTIGDADNLAPWVHTIESNQVNWLGSAISGGGSSVPFTFYANISSLNADSVESIQVYTTDNSGLTKPLSFSLSLLNDPNPPYYTVNSPLNFSYQKNDSHTFSVSVGDDESGFDASSPQIFYNWDDDTSSPFGNLDKSLTYVPSTYQTDINLNTGTLGADYYFFYYFNLTDRAGNTNTKIWHYIYVDDKAPVVAVNFPVNGSTTNSISQSFSYNMSDNSFLTSGELGFNPNVTCSLYFNNGSDFLVTSNTNASNVTEDIFDINFVGNGISDDAYTWFVQCTDLAGYVSQSESRVVTIDRLGPVISLSSHADNSVVSNTTNLVFSITDDLSGVHEAYSVAAGLSGLPYTLSSSNLNTGSNNVQIYANDTIGNDNNENFTIYVDTTPPSIVINSPADEAYNSNSFSVTPTDDYGTELNCTLSINGTESRKRQNNNTAFVFTTSGIADGNHSWQVSCTDDYGNSNETESRVVIVDATLPVVTLIGPIGAENDIDGVSSGEYNYTHTDTNYDDNCTFYVYNSTVDQVYTWSTGASIALSTVLPSNSPYHWNASCIDKAGNIGWSTTKTFYHDNITPILEPASDGSVGDTSVTIGWVVDEISNNTVYYGTNVSLLTSFVNGITLTMNPSIELSGLSASTLYYYLTQSCDSFGYCTNGTVYNFTTSATPSSAVSASGGGGGGSNTRGCADGYERIDGSCQKIEVVDANSCSTLWRCSDWSECSNGEQTRVCQDWNVCGDDEGKPDESQSCTEELELQTVEGSANNLAAGEDAGQDALGVGAATGVFSAFSTNWKPLLSALGILSLLGLAFWKKSIFTSGFSKIAKLKGSKLRKEEDEIRRKLREQGLIK